jgi:DNA polymerase-3 subunit alpha (Gram-positive type)
MFTFRIKTFTNGASIIGIKECSTEFYNNQTKIIIPKKINDIIKSIALAYGTDTWTNNAEPLLTNNICDIDNVIATRRDIVDHLVSKGVSIYKATKIAKIICKYNRENNTVEIKKIEDFMHSLGVEQWFIDSCKKIKFLYQHKKAVKAAHLAYRLAWFKYYYKEDFYNTFMVVYGKINKVKQLLIEAPLSLLGEVKKNDKKIDQLSPENYKTFEKYEEALEKITDDNLLLKMLFDYKINYKHESTVGFVNDKLVDSKIEECVMCQMIQKNKEENNE